MSETEVMADMQPDDAQDMRRFAPPAQRNREPIAEALQLVLPPQGLVLQIAEGSGEHAVHFARAFPRLTFQPTDPDPKALASIAAWTGHEGLMRGAGRILSSGAPLYLYGPYRRDGKQTSESNEKFERWLKSLSPEYGVRDLADVVDCAARHGFGPPEVMEMPANNFSVVFRRI